MFVLELLISLIVGVLLFWNSRKMKDFVNRPSRRLTYHLRCSPEALREFLRSHCVTQMTWWQRLKVSFRTSFQGFELRETSDHQLLLWPLYGHRNSLRSSILLRLEQDHSPNTTKLESEFRRGLQNYITFSFTLWNGSLWLFATLVLFSPLPTWQEKMLPLGFAMLMAVAPWLILTWCDVLGDTECDQCRQILEDMLYQAEKEHSIP